MFALKTTIFWALAVVLVVFIFIAVGSLRQSLRATILFQETCSSAAGIIAQELFLPAFRVGLCLGLFTTGLTVLLFFLIKAKINAD